jgi:hypothetical protein
MTQTLKSWFVAKWTEFKTFTAVEGNYVYFYREVLYQQGKQNMTTKLNAKIFMAIYRMKRHEIINTYNMNNWYREIKNFLASLNEEPRGTLYLSSGRHSSVLSSILVFFSQTSTG